MLLRDYPVNFPKTHAELVTESAQQKAHNLKANPLEGGSLPPAEKQSLQRTSGRGFPQDQDVISNSGGEAPAFCGQLPKFPRGCDLAKSSGSLVNYCKSLLNLNEKIGLHTVFHLC